MTAICGGGSSAPNPTITVATSYIVGNELENILQVALGVSESWASLIVFLGAQLITWNDLCSNDPPAMPTFDATDIAQILFNPIVDTGLPWQKLSDLFQIGAWYYGCQCVGAADPTPPAYPTYPVAAPLPDSSGAPSPVVANCPVYDSATNYTNPPGTSPGVPLASAWFGNAATRAVSNSANGDPSPVAYAIPPGATGMRIVGSVSCSGVGNSAEWDFFGYSATSASQVWTSGLISKPNGSWSPLTYTFTAGMQYMTLVAYEGGLDGTNIGLQIQIQWICSTPLAQQTPCCPPDPALTGMLQQILNYLSAIYAGLPSNPNSYADATVHSGLSGSGTITLVDSPLAIRTQITTDSAHLGVSAGDPNYLFDRGYVVPIINSAPVRQENRVVYNPQWFPLPLLTEQIGYSFGPGIVASITEITRGP